MHATRGAKSTSAARAAPAAPPSPPKPIIQAGCTLRYYGLIRFRQIVSVQVLGVARDGKNHFSLEMADGTFLSTKAGPGQPGCQVRIHTDKDGNPGNHGPKFQRWSAFDLIEGKLRKYL